MRGGELNLNTPEAFLELKKKSFFNGIKLSFFHMFTSVSITIACQHQLPQTEIL